MVAGAVFIRVGIELQAGAQHKAPGPPLPPRRGDMLDLPIVFRVRLQALPDPASSHIQE
jgi:hypothetical protein